MMSFTFLLSPTGIFCVLNLVIGTIYVTSQFKHQNRGGTQAQHQQFPDSPPQLGRRPSLLERVRSIGYSSYRHHEDEQAQPFAGQDAVNSPPQVERPSSFLERVKSINFSSYHSQEDEQVQPFAGQDSVNSAPQPARPSFLERVKSINFSSHHSNEDDDQPQMIPGQDAVNSSAPQLARQPSLLERVKSFKFSSVYHAVDRHEVEEMPDVYVEPAAPAKMKKSASEKAILVGDDREEAETLKQRSGSMTARAAPAAEDDDGVDEKANDFINRFRQQLKLQRMDSILRYRDMLNRGASR